MKISTNAATEKPQEFSFKELKAHTLYLVKKEKKVIAVCGKFVLLFPLYPGCEPTVFELEAAQRLGWHAEKYELYTQQITLEN